MLAANFWFEMGFVLDANQQNELTLEKHWL